MKVGIFSPYLDTLGGGERYLLTVGEFFLNRGDKVDIFFDKRISLADLKSRFQLNLEGINFVSDIFAGQNFLKKIVKTSKYDLIFYLSDGSIPTSLAKRNILHFQIPFKLSDQKNATNKLKLNFFSTVVCNSEFTKKFVDKTYGINSKVLYPPVDVEKFNSGKKENLIVSVGRFFSPSHPKKQQVLVESFINLCDGGLKNWKLMLIGGITGDSRGEVDSLKKQSQKYPVEIKTDANFTTLKDVYSSAKIYWHAAGFGEDLESHPELAEHFGISTVEAMSAGVVPIVFSGGGLPEIITDGDNGFLWENTNQLEKITLDLIDHEKKRTEIAKNSQARAKYFSKEHFFNEFEKILNHND